MIRRGKRPQAASPLHSKSWKEGIGTVQHKGRAIWAGAGAGLANGLFGGGGGMVFVPLMERDPALSSQQLYATCVGVIFPVCAVSAAIFLLRTEQSVSVVPYLLGGFFGGLLGGKLYGKVPVGFLKGLFAAFLFYAGIRYLL